MKQQAIIVSSNKNSLIYQGECEDCGHEVIASTDDHFCPICGSTLSGKPARNVKVKASVSDILKPCLKCATCNAMIFSNSKEDPVNLASKLYCTSCGSAEVDILDEDDVENYEEEDERDEEDNEKEVKEGLNNISIDDEIEASYLSKPEPQWIFFKNGNPFIKIRKSRQPEEAHSIFASSKFFDIFRQRVKETSLFATVKEFEAEIFDEASNDVVSTNDVEEVLYDKLQSQVLPKLLDCTSMAIEGMVRNVYPDLNKELKASFYDELKARGVTDAGTVVDAAFDASGSKVFAAVISKAMELYNKPEEIRSELKDTIFSTSNIKNGPRIVSEEDLESIETQSKLKAGNIPLNTNEPISAMSIAPTAISNIRSRIGLGKRN